MSDSETDLRGLASAFSLGPSWARTMDAKPARAATTDAQRELKQAPREDLALGGNGRNFPQKGGRPPFQKGERRSGPGENFPGRRDVREDTRPAFDETGSAQGVRVTLQPDAAAVHLIGKEIHQVARVYGLFDVANILLAERGRCRARFEVEENHPPLFLGTRVETVFLSREEALQYFQNADFTKEWVEEENIEVDAPTGNFQSVARCGLSGVWLGPPNYHAYQTNLRRLHRERFPHIRFEEYAAKVRTERGEEAVNKWLESAKQKTRWRLVGGDDTAWIEDRAEVERALVAKYFEQVFKEVRVAEVSAGIPGNHLSPSLLTSLRFAGIHARRHPAVLIASVCKALEAEHLPVFKRQGKLFTGPARPAALAMDAVLAERPAKMVNWIRANKPAKLAGLWQAVLPEGSTAPPADYAADLFWLLHQGHILLHTDDTLDVQEVRVPVVAQKKEKLSKLEKQQAREALTPLDSTPTESGTEETAKAQDAVASEAPASAATGEPPEKPAESHESQPTETP